MLLTKEELKALINGVWTGRYDQTKLPAWLFAKLANGYEGAAVKGWGNDLGRGAIKDLNLEKSLQENIYYFAAHKTAQELKVLHGLYQAAPNKYHFAKEAIKMNQNWNWHWYNTEYNVTTRMARAGREWQRIDASKGYYPKLMFVAVQDANTRAEHAALNGTIRPVDDPFWKMYFPPLSWNCRCRTERLQTGANTNLSQVNKPPVIEQFQQKVTDSKKIWADNHPYFHGLEAPVLKAVKQLVVQKIALTKVKEVIVKEKPWEFTTTDDLRLKLKAKHPSIDFQISVNKTDYDERMANFNFERFVDNAVKDFGGIKEYSVKFDTDLGVNMPDKFLGMAPGKISKIILTGDNNNMIFTISADTKNGHIYCKRTFSMRNGLRNVEHDFLQLPDQNQGGGFTKNFFQTLYREYQEAKIESISVHANITVGGYVWAQYGFSFWNKHQSIQSYIKERFYYDVNLRDDALKIVDEYFTQNPKSTTFPMNRLSKDQRFKKGFMNSHWYGEIDLKNNKVQKQVFEDYLYKAKK